MKRGGNILAGLLAVPVAVCGASSVAHASSEAGGFPYQQIIARNAFALKDPPPPPSTEPPKPPPPKITATGIANIFGTLRALLKVMEPAKPPTPAQEQSYILSPGERQGEVEVLSIDEKKGSITVNNYGTKMVLELRTNAPAATTPVPGLMPAAAPAAAAGMPGMPGGMANPAMAGGAFTAPGAAGAPPSPGLTTIPTRTLRLPVPGAPAAPQTPQMQQMQQAQQAQTPALSPEEQLILMHAIRESDPNNMPPMPGGELFPQMPPTLR